MFLTKEDKDFGMPYIILLILQNPIVLLLCNF